MALEGSRLVEKMLKHKPGSAGYNDDQDHLEALEQKASFQQALSVTGALQQAGLAVQCAERIDESRLPDFQKQSVRELRRHLVRLALFMVANGGDIERTYVKALMPSTF